MSSASEKVDTRAGPLPFNAMVSVFFLEETSLIKLQASSLSTALAGMTIPHASTTDDIGTLLSAEAGKPIALILPANFDCSALLSWAARAKGSTVKAARPCCIHVT